jgi:hypothetical protein
MSPLNDLYFLTMLQHNLGKAMKFYITNTLKKPNRVLVRQFFKQVEQLNSYIKNLPCMYYSPKVNGATKSVLLLDDSNLAMHLLCTCPQKWQRRYDLNDHSTPLSTRTLLLVFKNIETDIEVGDKPPSKNKAKGG